MSATKQEVEMAEVPFEFRHSCWFCGEPFAKYLTFPPLTSQAQYDSDSHIVLSCPHSRLAIQACTECYSVATQVKVSSIWQVNKAVKAILLKRYRKDLAIGVNWTKQELADSEFEQGNFAGFQRSAWFMYEVAKARVNYQAWPIVIGGVEIESTEFSTNFIFDGVVYPSLEQAIEHFAKVFGIDRHFFTAVLQHLLQQVQAQQNIKQQSVFAKAVRFCRLLVGSTPDERKRAFKTLTKPNAD